MNGCLDHLRDCPSVIPDEVIANIMNLAGVDTAVPHVLRICGIAAQKLIADVGTSAMHNFCLRKHLNIEDPEAKFILTLEDLERAFEEYDDGLCVPKKPEYYT